MPAPLQAMVVTSGVHSNPALERWLDSLPSVDVIAYTSDVAQAIIVTASQRVDLLVLDPELSDAARHIIVHHVQASQPAPFLMPMAPVSTQSAFVAPPPHPRV